ncbi:Thioredoxin domain-containing protein 17 [Eumeta japonica]|uniref:Thioredoxin domain-containing protein 17 n=1 Tax=Eumeta variegata TaxID=151549 RepID=A0A4C1SB12_EUMVA|nr:Thioredoxin domain-containing protein 17 [Eumeta japonica]
MVRKEFTRGYDGYKSSLEKFSKEKDSTLYIYFTADKDEQGQRWCYDCHLAQPFIDQAVETFAGPNAIFLTVEVGDRTL